MRNNTTLVICVKNILSVIEIDWLSRLHGTPVVSGRDLHSTVYHDILPGYIRGGITQKVQCRHLKVLRLSNPPKWWRLMEYTEKLS